MKAVILAGGLGTRFSEEIYLRPKPRSEIGVYPSMTDEMIDYRTKYIIESLQ